MICYMNLTVWSVCYRDRPVVLVVSGVLHEPYCVVCLLQRQASGPDGLCMVCYMNLTVWSVCYRDRPVVLMVSGVLHELYGVVCLLQRQTSGTQQGSEWIH